MLPSISPIYKKSSEVTTSKFMSLFAEIESLLFGFAMRLTSSKENAKDLMQETLMRCYANKHKFEAGTNFKSWMTTVMYHSFVNHYRKRKSKRKVLQTVNNYSQITEGKSIGVRADEDLLHKELKSIVNELPNKFHHPFQMLLDGYKYQEISETLDVPIGTIKSRIHYARQKTKKKLNEIYDVNGRN
jgi:RNA polymerase sigma factor (sigma-70 family)